MVGRTPVRDITPARDIQPAARPVDTYVRPAAPERSPLHHVAQSLGSLSAGVSGLLSQRQGEADNAARLQGEAEFYRQHSGGYAQAVSQGEIPPTASPSFMEGFRNAQGNVTGIQMRQEFNSEFMNWDGRHTASPEEFNTWFGEFVQGRLATDDPAQLESLLPHVESLTEDAWGNYERVRGERVMADSITAHLGVSSLTIDEAINQAPMNGGLPPYDALWSDILEQREAALSTGISPSSYDEQLFNTIVAKALEHGDLRVLEFLDETLPGDDIPLGQQPDFLAKRLEAEGQLGRILANRDEALVEEQERLDQERLDAITRGVSEFLQANPAGEIDASILEEWETLDPQARQKLEGLRTTFSNARGREDPRAILEIERMIQEGLTPAELMSMGADPNSPINDPQTFVRLMQRAQDRAEFGGEMLRSESYKRFADLIEERTGTDDYGLLGGSNPTEETIAAMRDLEMAAIEWLSANPNATLLERETAMDEIGTMILGRIDANREYRSQEDFTQDVGESERQAPATADQGTPREDRLDVLPGVGDPAAQSPDQETESLLQSIPSAGDAMLSEEVMPTDAERLRGALEAILPEGTDADEVLIALQEQTGLPVLDDFEGVRESASTRAEVDESAPLTPYEVYETDEPPSLNALDPALRQRIEQYAADMGVTPEEINMRFWQRIRERFFPTPYAPEEGGSTPGLDAIDGALSEPPVLRPDGIASVPAPTSSGSYRSFDIAESMLGMNERTHTEVLSDFFEENAGIEINPAHTAWCAAFVNGVLGSTGVEGTDSLLARSFLNFGEAVDEPQRGDVVVLRRGSEAWMGHVGFFAGYDDRGNILVLGGNQRNSVSIAPYAADRLLGFRRAEGQTAIEQQVDRVEDTLSDAPGGNGLIRDMEDARASYDRAQPGTARQSSPQRTRTAAMSEDQEVRTLAPVLDLIALTEGTGRPGSNDDNYNETLGHGRYTDGDVDLVNMTLDEIDDIQTQILNHPRNHLNSSAVGRYQFIRTTLRELRQVYDIPGDLKFTPEFQDWLAVQRMRQMRGLDAWLEGRLSTDRFVNNLSLEWASLPRTGGEGSYRGQRVGASPQEVVAALEAARRGRA